MRSATSEHNIFDIVFVTISRPVVADDDDGDDDDDEGDNRLQLAMGIHATGTTMTRMKRNIMRSRTNEAFPVIPVSLKCEECRLRTAGEEALVTRVYTLVCALRNAAQFWPDGGGSCFDMEIKWTSTTEAWNLEWEPASETPFVSRRMMVIHG
jgi:hypothetical protein